MSACARCGHSRRAHTRGDQLDRFMAAGCCRVCWRCPPGCPGYLSPLLRAARREAKDAAALSAAEAARPAGKRRLPVWHVVARGRHFLLARKTLEEAEARVREYLRLGAHVPLTSGLQRRPPTHLTITRNSDGASWRVHLDHIDIAEFPPDTPVKWAH